jgi:DNA-binding PadR family transcriptional regulator
MTELAFHVLLSLADGPAHGYAIGKDIEERTGGRLDPATGSLYQVIKRLTDDGLIRPLAAPPCDADARRKYFALTVAGRQAAAAELRRLEEIVQLGRKRQLHKAGAR